MSRLTWPMSSRLASRSLVRHTASLNHRNNAPNTTKASYASTPRSANHYYQPRPIHHHLMHSNHSASPTRSPDAVLNPYPDPDCNGFRMEGLTDSQRADMLRCFDRDMEELIFYAFASRRDVTNVDKSEYLIMRRDRKDLLMVGCLNNDVLKSKLGRARDSGRQSTKASERRRRRERMSEEGLLP